MALLKDSVGSAVGAARQNKTAMTILGITIIVVVIVVVYQIYKSIKVGTLATGQAIGNETVSLQTGIPVARVVYIRTQAQRLWDDGVRNYWLLPGYYYDEKMFIDTINSMATAKEVMLLDEFYHQIAKDGKRLRDVIENAFNTDEKKRLNQQWLSVLYT